MATRRYLGTRFDVDLVSEKSERHTQSAAEFSLQLFDFFYRAAAEFGCNAGKAFVGVVACECDGHNCG